MDYKRKSITSKNFTQGGQVTAYMVRMFVQMNNMLAYYLLIVWGVFTFGWVVVRCEWQAIKHGALYWWVESRHSFEALRPGKAIYEFTYEDVQGAATTTKFTRPAASERSIFHCCRAESAAGDSYRSRDRWGACRCPRRLCLLVARQPWAGTEPR
ncbi:hypothetical protein DM872_11500 [Pseudomonas taiwanensis]|nr:hypothetical protein [Pseudomonas taiwanensis]